MTIMPSSSAEGLVGMLPRDVIGFSVIEVSPVADETRHAMIGAGEFIIGASSH